MSNSTYNQLYNKTKNFDRDLNTLCGRIDGILADKEVTQQEHEAIVAIKTPYHNVNRILQPLVPTVESYREAQKAIESLKPESSYQHMQSTIQKLRGLLAGITDDRIVNAQELETLRIFLKEHRKMLSNDALYRELLPLVDKVLEDGTVGPEEEQEFLGHIDYLDDIYTKNHTIEFKDKVFVFSGRFRVEKKDFQEIIEILGGSCKQDVTKAIDYLVIADKGSPDYAQDTNGTKAQQAIYYNELYEDVNIKIIREDSLVNALPTPDGTESPHAV